MLPVVINENVMKKSNALIFLIFANIVMFYIDTGLIPNIVIRIQVSILVVGYFIVKQLEQNSENKSHNKIEKIKGELYCFECEIEIPINKDQNGILSCRNCGLVHK